MGTQIEIPEHPEWHGTRYKRDLSSAVNEDLTVLYTLLGATGDKMAGHFTADEMSLLCEVFKNDEYEPARVREWPTLLAWDVEDVERYEKLSAPFKVNADVLIEKLEELTPLQALWLLKTIREMVASGDSL